MLASRYEKATGRLDNWIEPPYYECNNGPRCFVPINEATATQEGRSFLWPSLDNVRVGLGLHVRPDLMPFLLVPLPHVGGSKLKSLYHV